MSFKLQEPEDMVLKFEYANEIDFSFIDTNKLYTEDGIAPINEFIKKYGKEFAKQYDIAFIKDAIIKAKLYDKDFNPVTVTDRVKKQEVALFCEWLLRKIKQDKYCKKDIVKELEIHAKIH